MNGIHRYGVKMAIFFMILSGVLFCSHVVSGEDLRIVTFNVSVLGSNAPVQTERIFQGLDPDIALLQEWNVNQAGGESYREYVDDAFGPEFYYYLGYSQPGSYYQPNGIVSRWEIQTCGGWPDTSGINKPDFAWAIINIPGGVDLGVVSIHLKAGDTTENKEQRVEEAQLIKNYLESSLVFNPSSNYIVVGGDLNVVSESEWCIDTFATFLEPVSYRPRDRRGDKDTNKIRTRPYDWIMPNQILDAFHDPVVIGTEDYEYPYGLVFDSHVFSRWSDTTTAPASTPLWNLPPVLYGDTHSIYTDHCPVVKDYDILPSPIPTPTLTITPVPSPSTTPSLIPTPTLQPTLSPPPSNTPTLPPTLTPKPTFSRTPTPAPTPTIEIIMGPVSGRVYDRITGEGVPDVYVRAMGAGIGSSGISDTYGYYSTGPLNADTYLVFADTFMQRNYREQYYNQKPTEKGATMVASDSTGIDFPLYRMGYYPTPTVTPSPYYFNSSIDSGDYDGDGTSDIAIYRPASGLWAIQGITRVYFGTGNDQPAVGDYNGDGTSDITIFRDGSGLWAIMGISRIYFGRSLDIPVPGDYTGDGICDIGVFRPASGLWAVRGETRFYFGAMGDWPVPYNGDRPEKYFAVYRPSSGLWAVKNSTRIYYGAVSDQPVPANYEGLSPYTAQLGIYRASTGLWAIRNLTRIYYGGVSDRPAPGNYQGTCRADVAVFRDQNGLWSIRGLTRLYYGKSGDVPISGLAINPSGVITP